MLFVWDIILIFFIRHMINFVFLQSLQEKIMSLEDAFVMKQDKLHRPELKDNLWTLYNELRKIVFLI